MSGKSVLHMKQSQNTEMGAGNMCGLTGEKKDNKGF